VPPLAVAPSGCVCDFDVRDTGERSCPEGSWCRTATAAAPWPGERGSRVELHKTFQKGGVDNVNSFGVGLGRTSAGLPNASEQGEARSAVWELHAPSFPHELPRRLDQRR
jgi:hypothetical protein